MSDESATTGVPGEEKPVEEAKEVQNEEVEDDKEKTESVGSKEKLVRPKGRVRTESEGYGITEEQEKKLLAEDEDDLDVIECYVDDFGSDMEEEFRRKEAKRIEGLGKDAEEGGKGDAVEVLQVMRIVHSQEDPLEGLEKEIVVRSVAEEEIDQDVIQIVEEDEEGLLEETASTPVEQEKVGEPPEASVHGDTENERILSKPLVKQQVVMEASEESSGKDGKEFKDKESLKVDEQVATPTGTQEDSDAEQPLVIADSVEANVGTMPSCHQEDPDVLQLKLDLYQNMGEMDYEPDDHDDHRDPHKDSRTDDCSEEKLERRFQIKEEPQSPVRDRLDLLQHDEIEIIVLLSSDDDIRPEPKPKKSKKKSKKMSKQRSKSECSVIDAAETASIPEKPQIKQTTSSKSLHSSDLICMDEELLKTGFRMELRKRKSATQLEEYVTPSSSKKRRNPRKSIESLGQSKSKNSITSADTHPSLDKPPKKSHKPSSFEPISTAKQLQINSLFADCENPKPGAPASILDDDMPLITDDHKVARREAMDPFEKVFRAELYEKQSASSNPRQAILIDVPVKAKVQHGEEKHKSSSSSSAAAQKPKQVSEIRRKIMQSLEDDLAMTSSDEEEVEQNKNGSSASKKSSALKRARPQQKQHIDDYFCPSPGGGGGSDKRDNGPVDAARSLTDLPQSSGKKLKQSQVKRRKKRRISSSSSFDGETATNESISLGGTSSCTMSTNTARSEEVVVAAAEAVEQEESAKTDAMRVVLSPLTDEKIEKLSKCNTPKKVRALSKASQTELKGLTWSIYLDQIDFHSDYFEKLYQLIKNGRELKNQVRRNDFEGVVMAGRDAVLPPTPPERSPQRPAGQANGHARSNIEELLFQRADEVQYVSTARVDPVARERMERSVRSNFRIPKVVKQPSRSPQDVTSSTQHEHDQQQQYKEDEPRRASTGYSNDRPPDQRRLVATGSRSPLRFDSALSFNRPEPEPRNNPVSAAAETVRPLRRTIRNDNVQPAVAASAQPQPPSVPAPPAETGFPTYGPPEQPSQPYRPSGGNIFQQPQPQQQLGGYMASGDLDVKPNLSALAGQAGLLGPNMINPTRFLDSFSIICQLTMMQMMQQQQQQLQFSAMNPQGPAVAPVAGSNPAMAPQMMPQQQHGQLPLIPEPSTSGGPRFGGVPVPDAAVPPDEISDQISQIFGCIDHLKGRCIKNPCQYSHTLPTEANLRQMLLNSAQDVVMTTYQFIVGQDNLFLRYFPVYAEVMGRRNMRHQLVDAVPHCEQSKRAFSYYRFIVEGLAINGTLNRAKAVQLVLEKHRKINFDQINVLITLILDTNEDIPQFFQWLDQFSHVQDYHYETTSINRLLKFTTRSARPQVDIIKLTYRLILNVPTGTETFIDTNLLLEFVELIIKSNLGLDPEKIRHKYRENELQSATRR